LLRVQILFCIAPKENKVPFGYILCNSPLATFPDTNKQIGDWTIEFWLAARARNYGLMDAAVNKTLGYLKEMEVPCVLAYVEKENTKSIRLLLKNNFIVINETSDDRMYIFKLILNA
jgi:RimJ/RimL family protein N-acetyltransferase